VTLPRAPSQAGHDERPAEPALIIDAPAQPVVVVVEDDALVLEGMSGLLRSWDCHVVPFSSAKAALAAAAQWEESPPDLIIADYSLPGGKSGLELIATLRSAFGGEIAAFLISGDTSPDRIREVRCSGLHLLYKPVTPMALRAMLVRYLKMARMPVAPVMGSRLTA
jgi:CheY-like chemotaxis protein